MDFIKDYYNKGFEGLSKVYLKLVNPPNIEPKPKMPKPPVETDSDSDKSFLEELYISDKNHAAFISQQGEDLRKKAIQL